MPTFEITKASARGQIVLPKKIRDEMRIHEGDYLAIYSDGENILVKKVQTQEIIASFQETAEKLSNIAKERGIDPEDVEEAVADVRRRKKDPN